MDHDNTQNPPTPSTCPSWCHVDHRGAHPEDLIHQDEGILVPAIVKPPGVNRPGDPDLLIVQRNRHFDDTHDWIDIQSADEGSTRLVLSLESTERLHAALARSLNQ